MRPRGSSVVSEPGGDRSPVASIDELKASVASLPPRAAPTRLGSATRTQSHVAFAGQMEARPVRVSISQAALDQGLAKWTAVIRRKMRRKRKRTIANDEVLEIVTSVFPAVESDPFLDQPETFDDRPPTTLEEFAAIVQAVEQAIEHDVHPRRNAKGSSGSYLARDESGEIVGVFKPKDEEPYGRLNPKWTKWAHRTFLGPVIGFGRACLIPNFSALSEAGASLVDRRLGTYIVPRTEIASLASPAFFYDWIDRNAFERTRKPRPLPLKPGSFQLFARGFTDGSVFLRDHPWPTGDEDSASAPAHRRHKRSVFSACCGRAGHFDDDGAIAVNGMAPASHAVGGFTWTEDLMAEFRAELEKLVIYDFLIRNTDRGLDNLMVRVFTDIDDPSHRQRIRVVAIDNSLAFPHEHPRGYRDYPYGWLWLPASLIGLPFSEATRKRFLPLLSSAEWWAETTRELRVLFSSDPDFSARMFDRQLAVMKGQAYAIVQTLLSDEDGPLELCRRPRVLVWDDRVELAADEPIPLSPVQETRAPLPPMQEAPTERTALLSDIVLPTTATASASVLPPQRLKRGVSERPFAPSSPMSGLRVLEQLARLDRHRTPPAPRLRRAMSSSHGQHARSRSELDAATIVATAPRPSLPQNGSSSRRHASELTSGGGERAEQDRIVIIERLQEVRERPWLSIW